MANSLVKLTLESNQYEQGLRKAKKGFEDFTRSLGVNMKTLSTYAIAAGAVTTAMKVMKDAFFNNEQQLDDWGRTVKSSESLYKGFLNSLNTGDISGYLSNISEITKAAREAYDALDELATFKAFNRVNIAKARAGYSESVADYREGKGSKDSVQQASANLIKEMKQTQKLQNDAYEKAIADLARQRQVSPEDLRKVMTGNYGSFKELKELNYSAFRDVPHVGFGGRTYYTQEAIPANERERLAQAIKHINDTELDALQALGEAAQMTSVEINNQRRAVARILNGRSGGDGGGGAGGGTKKSSGASVSPFTAKDFAEIGIGITTSMDTLLAQQKYWKKALSGATNMFEAGDAQAMLDKLQKQIDAQPLALRFGLDTESAVSLKESMKGLPISDLQPLPYAPSHNNSTVDISEYVDVTQKATNGMSAVVSGLQQIGINLPESAQQVLGGIQGLISVINGVQSVIEAFGSGTKAAEISATTTNTGALTALTTAVMANTAALGLNSSMGFADLITPFARGGIVHAATGMIIPGNDFSDRTPVLASSGELILNKAQQGNIASQLQDIERHSGGNAQPFVSGEQIYLGLNNYLRRTGRGELMTARG